MGGVTFRDPDSPDFSGGPGSSSDDKEEPKIDVIGDFDLTPPGPQAADFGIDDGSYLPPVYVDGDEWGFVKGWSIERIVDMQSRLIAAGFLDYDDVRDDGVWGQAEAKALKDVFEIANGTGRSWFQVVQGAMDFAGRSGAYGSGGGGGGGARRAPLQIRLSDPDDLKAAFRQAARRSTGGVFIDPAQLDEMVSAYQEKEAAAQRQAYAGASEVTAPPSADTFTEQQIEETDPGAIEANKFASMTRVLMELTSGGL